METVYKVQNIFYIILTNRTSFLSGLLFQSSSSYVEILSSTRANFIISLLLVLHLSEVNTEHMPSDTIISQYLKRYIYSILTYNIIFSCLFDYH